jgi:hypothetical protein
MIEFEVIAFVKRWRTIGLFCEDPFESIHAVMNRYKAQYACVRDRSLRDKLIYTSFDRLKKTAEMWERLKKKRSRGPYDTAKKKKQRTTVGA